MDGLPKPSRAVPVHDRDLGRRQQALQLRSVAVLGRSEEPERGAETGGEGQPATHVLAGDGPGRLEQESVVPGDPELLPRPGPVAHRRVDVEGIAHHRGRDPPVGQLTPAHVVDGDVDPSRMVRRRRCAGEALTLPRQVVVMENGPPGAQDSGHGGRRRGIEGQ